MNGSFASLRVVLAALALAAFTTAGALAAADPSPLYDNGALPAGGKFKECHGYVRHISTTNLKVHCIDGVASDQAFLYLPRYANLRDGKSIQVKDLLPQTPVHVYYTQSLGIKKAYKIFVADPQGNGIYGFRT